MRGYFAIGVDRLSKPMNAGNLFRSAHAFGASFTFTIGGKYPVAVKSDTSQSLRHMPFYQFDSMADLSLPQDCSLVGVEMLDAATFLPTFRHPRRAVYVFGPEKGSLSPELVAQCNFLVKIPTKFCINVAMAGAIVMYDRALNLGEFKVRPMMQNKSKDAN